MSDPIYRPEHTALLFVDPYNDFLSEGGKLWPNVAAIAKEVRPARQSANRRCRSAARRDPRVHRSSPSLGTW